ncbi:MAG: hypothetical protein RLO48_00020, partial [Bauldia litoralis]
MLLSLLLPTPASVTAQDFSFELLGDAFAFAPSINEAGEVALLRSTGEGSQILTGKPGALTVAAEAFGDNATSGQLRSFRLGDYLSFNDNGQFAVVALERGSNDEVLAVNDQVVAREDGIDIRQIDRNATPEIINDGSVYFQVIAEPGSAVLNGGNGVWAKFDGGLSQEFPRDFGDLQADNNGNTYARGPFFRPGVYAGPNPEDVVIRIAMQSPPRPGTPLPGGTELAVLDSWAVNDNGDFLLQGYSNDTDTYGIWAGPPDALREVHTIPREDGFFSPFSMNDDGDVLYVDRSGDQGQLILGEGDGGSRSVIKIGDPLFGSTVTSLHPGRRSLNTADQLTFLAGLEDGRLLSVYGEPSGDEALIQSWVNLGSGDFDNPGNWLPAGVPNSNDRIDFFQSGSYAVDLDEDRTVHSLRATAGDVTIDLAGHKLSFTDDSNFSTNGWVEVDGSDALLTTLTLRDGMADATGGLGRLDIARAGRGKLVIDNAAVEANVLLSVLSTGRGELLVTGANSRLGGNLFNTGEGSTTITVRDGAQMVNGHMTFGLDEASNDELIVTGAGSKLTVTTGGDVGDGVLLAAVEGAASVSVLDGGTIEAWQTRVGGVDTTIAVPFPIPGLGEYQPLENARANLLVSGADSLYKVFSVMQVGQIGRATLLVDQGGTVDAETFRLNGGSPESGEAFSSLATISDPGSLLKTTTVEVGGAAHLVIENGASVETDLYWLFGQSTIRGVDTQVTAISRQTAVRLFGGSSKLIIEDGAKLTSNSVRHIIGSGTSASESGQPGALVHVRGAGSLWDMGDATDLL